MSKPYTFNNQEAFKDYIKQFLRIFSGFQVEYGVDRDGDGNLDRKTCPIFYGDMDRITANILHKDGTFVPTSMPLMSGVLTGIELNVENRKAKYHVDSVTRVRGSDNTTVVNQRLMGVPYTISMDLSIYASNSTQMFQLLEQILLMFNPKLTIQKSDNIIDWSYLTEVELVSVAPESNFPPATDERYMVYTLSFLMGVWLDYPMKESAGIINQIITTIKDNTNDSGGTDLESFVVNTN
jgi:T4-like virus Myoviridae tail sheath stabiliser